MSNSVYGIQSWAGGTQYSRNDIVLYNGIYYYSNSDNNSAGTFDPSKWGGYSSINAVAKPTFPFVPSYGSPTNLQPRVKKIQFSDGYEQRMADGINNFLLEFDLTFENRDLAENTAINHFLMQRAGIESFYYTPPSPWNATRIYICESWQSVPVYQNNYVIKAKFVEKTN